MRLLKTLHLTMIQSHAAIIMSVISVSTVLFEYYSSTVLYCTLLYCTVLLHYCKLFIDYSSRLQYSMMNAEYCVRILIGHVYFKLYLI